jgi:hypothetical protein
MTPQPAGPGAQPGQRVLRVLSGAHAGAQSALHQERVLVGNLQGECDIVLDVTRPERHACLVRTSVDGWAVLGIAGDLWVERQYVEPQQTLPITPGQVITLGRVSFSLGDPEQIDWDALSPPLELQRPTPTGPLPQAPLPVAPEAVLQRWRALRLASGLSLGVMVLTAAGVYATQTLDAQAPRAAEARQRLQTEQARLAALPWAREVSLSPHPERTGRVLAQGYVPRQEQLAELTGVLRQQDAQTDIRLVAVDRLSGELLKRFDLDKSPERLRYEAMGRFTLTTPSRQLVQHDLQARMALQELPAVQGLVLDVEEALGPDGQPLRVRYTRSAEKPGDLEVSPADPARLARRHVVQELRLGALPSVVLDNGTRYFTGALLPDGSRLQGIQADRLIVMHPQGGERVVLLDEPEGVSSLSATASKNLRK